MYRKHWYIRRSSLTPSDPSKVSHSHDCSIWREDTVDPRIADDCRSLWQLQFGDLSLDSFILQCNLLDQQDFLPVTRTVDIWAQSDVALYPLLGKVDYGFVKYILTWCQSVVPDTDPRHVHVLFSSQYYVDSSTQKPFSRCMAVYRRYAQRPGRAPIELSRVPQE